MATISSVTKKTMTKASAVLDGITFDSITRGGDNSGVPYIMADTPWKTLQTSTTMKYSINAVDIDWNAAILPHGDIENDDSKTIYTTGDLLSLIDKMNEEIYVLSAAVIALGVK